MDNPVERREYLRAPVNVFVNEDLPGRMMLARALDISEAGLRYSKPRAEYARTVPEVQLRFCLPGDEDPVEARAFVVTDHLDGSTHSTSVQFTQLSFSDAERIRQYVIRRNRAELFELLRENHLGSGSD
jgi:hypothetical protein